MFLLVILQGYASQLSLLCHFCDETSIQLRHAMQDTTN